MCMQGLCSHLYIPARTLEILTLIHARESKPWGYVPASIALVLTHTRAVSYILL